jgi:glyoxylase-like metal-dependent hydrolase (beta-lactamase superfamily II)
MINLSDDFCVERKIKGSTTRCVLLHRPDSNVVFIGTPTHWVLVDAGMPKSGDELRLVAEDLFGAGSKPAAIVLTHGHFDHVGGIVHLVKHWNVPVYAHPMEFPFLRESKVIPNLIPALKVGY